MKDTTFKGSGFVNASNLDTNQLSVEYKLHIEGSPSRQGWLVGSIQLNDPNHIDTLWNAQDPLHLLLENGKQVNFVFEKLHPAEEREDIQIEWQNPTRL